MEREKFHLSLRKKKLEETINEKRTINKIHKDFFESEKYVSKEIIDTMDNLEKFQGRSDFLSFLLRNEDENYLKFCIDKLYLLLYHLEEVAKESSALQLIFTPQVIDDLFANLSFRQNDDIRVSKFNLHRQKY